MCRNAKRNDSCEKWLRRNPPHVMVLQPMVQVLHQKLIQLQLQVEVKLLLPGDLITFICFTHFLSFNSFLFRPFLPPPIDPTLIQKESYIPFEFAQAKVIEVSSDLHLIKLGYESYLEKLQFYHTASQQEMKTHYENYILNLKQKALQRFEFEKQSNRQQIVSLEKEIQNKEEQMEDLRDMNATRISEFQSMIHILKGQIVETEKMSQYNQHVTKECRLVLDEMLGDLETSTQLKLQKESQLTTEELHRLQEELQRYQTLYDTTLTLQTEGQNRYENDLHHLHQTYTQQQSDDKEVKNILENLLFEIEQESWEGVGRKIQSLEFQLTSTQLGNVSHEERLVSEHEAAITKLTEEYIHEKQLLEEQLERFQEESRELKRKMEVHLKGEEENSLLASQLSTEIHERDANIHLLKGQMVKSGESPSSSPNSSCLSTHSGSTEF
jgi:hypothetical protein